MTLVELLIAIFITGVISAALFGLYNSFFKQTHTQDILAEAQQNARVAMELVEKEVMNAGYDAGTLNAITTATANSIEFIYTDPSTDIAVSPTAGQRLKVLYAIATDAAGIKYLTRSVGICANAACDAYSNTRQAVNVIPYANALSVTYLDLNGNAIADTSSQANRNTIRFAKINFTAETSENILGTTAPKTFALETTIRLRNLGVGQVASDTTPPAAPAGVQVRDPGICGRLKVKWTQNTEGDLSGYKIYYGTTSGSYTGTITIPTNVLSGTGYSCTNVSGSVQCTITPTSPALTYTSSTAPSGTGTMYYVSVLAYDNSMNSSPLSAEVSGNPATSNSVYDSGVNDSTLNPVKPVAVTGFTGAQGAADNQVVLSWSAYNSTANPDVTGFRIYRSTSAFASYPIDPAAASVTWVAGEPGSGKPSLSSTATTYTDTDPTIGGCQVYYYAIAPVNCDPTLISDEGGDATTKKYVAADYGVTYGDGSSGAATDSPSGSNTSAKDSVTPGQPVISKRADGSIVSGYKRSYITFTNPSDSDFDHTLVYYSTTAYPTVNTTAGSASYGVISGGNPVPDTNNLGHGVKGYFQGGSSTVSFVHDSETAASIEDVNTMHAPALVGAAYYYIAVAYDKCGNPSSDTGSSTTLATLCGDGVAGSPEYGPPSSPTGAAVAGCGATGGITATWNAITSTSSTNPDAAGYRLYRSPTATFSSTTNPNALNTVPCSSSPGVSCYLGFLPIGSTTTFTDTFGLVEGGTTKYSYGVMATDCVYENRYIASGDATYALNYSGYSTANGTNDGGVTPGMIDRDMYCPGAGSCTKTAHREVQTGVTIDNTGGNGTGVAAPKSSRTHSNVVLFLNNTSAGAMTVTGISLSWINSAAHLNTVNIGGGRSGVGNVSTSVNSSLSVALVGNPPYTTTAQNVTLTNVSIPANTRYVPITLSFRDSSDTSNVDMREDQFLITLNVKNDQTGTTTCTSYMTVSMASQGIYVPLGPTVSSTQQNKPSSPTFGYPVPGASGTNTVPNGSYGQVQVLSGSTVTITASVDSNTTSEVTGSKIAISSATLYYAVTDYGETTAPSSSTDYTAVNMTQSGNNWSASIPDETGRRVWYYVIATDADGNWDRDPEINEGAYVYDQKSANICDVTPNAPSAFSATPSGSDAILSWTAPTQYTSGASILAADVPLKYRIFKSGVQIGSDQTATTYTDAALATSVYNYTVRTVNNCASPGANVSVDSSTAAVCIGASGQATLSVSPSSIYRGGSFSASVVDCLAINGGYSSTVETVNSSSGFTGFYASSTAPATGSINPYRPTIPETGAATGTFNVTITTTGNVADTAKLLTLGTDTISVYYPYASPSTRTISVTVDPCTNTPNAPTGLSGTIASGTNKPVVLTWSAPTLNTDGSALTDLGGYKVYEKVCNNGKPNCTGSDIRKDWFLRASTASGTRTATLSNDQGAFSSYIYYYKVTAIDSCSTPNEGAGVIWNETK